MMCSPRDGYRILQKTNYGSCWKRAENIRENSSLWSYLVMGYIAGLLFLGKPGNSFPLNM